MTGTRRALGLTAVAALLVACPVSKQHVENTKEHVRALAASLGDLAGVDCHIDVADKTGGRVAARKRLLCTAFFHGRAPAIFVCNAAQHDGVGCSLHVPEEEGTTE